MTPTSVTSSPVARGSAALLKDVMRRLTHELNNAANGVAVNLEVVKSRADHADSGVALAPFAVRASEQMEELTALQEVVRMLLQVMMDCVDDDKVTCQLSSEEDAFEITFLGTSIPHSARSGRGATDAIALRAGPRGVILSLPRSSPSSE